MNRRVVPCLFLFFFQQTRDRLSSSEPAFIAKRKVVVRSRPFFRERVVPNYRSSLLSEYLLRILQSSAGYRAIRKCSTEDGFAFEIAFSSPLSLLLFILSRQKPQITLVMPKTTLQIAQVSSLELYALHRDSLILDLSICFSLPCSTNSRMSFSRSSGAWLMRTRCYLHVQFVDLFTLSNRLLCSSRSPYLASRASQVCRTYSST